MESKGKPEKGRKEGEKRRSCKSSIVARLEDPNLIPYNTRGRDFPIWLFSLLGAMEMELVEFSCDPQWRRFRV